jgi:CheY-like chemotaxis protein
VSAIRILHVDDEPDIREVVDISLGLNPAFEVRACASGSEAIVAAAEWSPYLILLDVMMPGMDGPTTFREMRTVPELAGIPVILLTAKVQAADQKRFSDLGVAAVMFKPFDPLVLAQDIAAALGWQDA